MIRKFCHYVMLLGLFAFMLPEPGAAQSSQSKKSSSTSKSSSSKKASSKKKTTSKTTKPRSPQRNQNVANRPDPQITPITFESGPYTNAAAAFVFDPATGRTLYEKNPDELRPPASTQKLLTALIIAETGNLDKRVVIQHSDTLAEPVKLYLKAGESYTRRQLLEALLVRSFNDVAVALARDNAGSVEAFAAKMNRRAAALGATRSRFVNPNGLPAPGQLSTARDMARVALASYRNPTIRTIVNKKTLTFTRANGRVSHYKNTNRVLRGWPYCNGMKTGYTKAAGHCLISSASHNGREVIVVILGNNRRVWQESCSLLAWGLNR